MGNFLAQGVRGYSAALGERLNDRQPSDFILNAKCYSLYLNNFIHHNWVLYISTQQPLLWFWTPKHVFLLLPPQKSQYEFLKTRNFFSWNSAFCWWSRGKYICKLWSNQPGILWPGQVPRHCAPVVRCGHVTFRGGGIHLEGMVVNCR